MDHLYMVIDGEIMDTHIVLPYLIEDFAKENGINCFIEAEERVIFVETNLSSEESYIMLDKIFDQLSKSVGIIALEDPKELEEFNEYGPAIRTADYMGKILVEKGEYDKANVKLRSIISELVRFANKYADKDEEKRM